MKPPTISLFAIFAKSFFRLYYIGLGYKVIIRLFCVMKHVYVLCCDYAPVGAYTTVELAKVALSQADLYLRTIFPHSPIAHLSIERIELW